MWQWLAVFIVVFFHFSASNGIAQQGTPTKPATKADKKPSVLSPTRPPTTSVDNTPKAGTSSTDEVPGGVAPTTTTKPEARPSQPATPTEPKSPYANIPRLPVPNPNNLETIPVTAFEVPENDAEPRVPVKAAFVLKDKEGKPIPTRSINYGINYEASRSDSAELKKAKVELAKIDAEVRKDVETEIYSKGRSQFLRVGSDGKLRYKGILVPLILGAYNEAFPEAEQPAALAQFTRFLENQQLYPSDENLNNLGGAPLYLGVLVDGVRVKDAKNERLFQDSVLTVIDGNDHRSLQSDEAGKVDYNKRVIGWVAYRKGEDDKLTPASEADTAEIDLKLRRQAKQSLIVRRQEETNRLNTLAAANKSIEAARAIIEKTGERKTQSEKNSRIEDLKLAVTTLQFAHDTIVKTAKTEAEKTAPLAAIAELKTKSEEALDAALYPIVVAAPKDCPNFEIRQERTSVWSLRRKEGQSNIAVAYFPQEPTWHRCSGNSMVLLARLETSFAQHPKLEKATVKFTLRPETSDLTQKQVVGAAHDQLLAFQGNELVLARVFQPDTLGEVKYATLGSGTLVVQLILKTIQDQFFEFATDGSFYRGRLVPPAGWKGFAFIVSGDNSIQIYQEGKGEQLIARARALDLKAAVQGGESLMFFGTEVQDAKGNAVNTTRDRAVFLATAAGVKEVSAPNPKKQFQAIAYDADRGMYELTLEGNALYHEEISSDGTRVESRINLASDCQSKFGLVVAGDGTTVEVADDIRKARVAVLSQLAQVLCKDNALLFLAKKLEVVDEDLKRTQLPASNLSFEDLAKGGNRTALVVLRDDGFRTLTVAPEGFAVTQPQVNAKGFLFTLGGPMPMTVQTNADGEWISPVWHGSLASPHYSALLTDQGDGYLFHNGKHIADVKKVVSLSAKGDTLGVVADYFAAGPAMNFKLLRSEVALAPENPTVINGTGLGFVLTGPTLTLASKSVTADDPEKSEPFSAVELFDTLDDGKPAVGQRFWMAGNSDYTLLVNQSAISDFRWDAPPTQAVRLIYQ